MARKIFVNYRREDDRAAAARIHDRLASVFGSSNVFLDVDDLLPGQRFDKELDEALARTEIFVAIIGSRWMQLLSERQAAGGRDYVREEIAGALARGIPVIPVLIERASLPRQAELPEDIQALALHQKHDVSHEHFGRDMEALVRAIRTDHTMIRADGGVRGGRVLAGAFSALAIAVVGAYLADARFARPPISAPAPGVSDSSNRVIAEPTIGPASLCNLGWVSEKNGIVPSGALSGGQQASWQLYVCRTISPQGWLPGKLIRGWACYVAEGGQEIAAHEYEVLIADSCRTKWQYAPSGVNSRQCRSMRDRNRNAGLHLPRKAYRWRRPHRTCRVDHQPQMQNQLWRKGI
jgi:hypothetical protein